MTAGLLAASPAASSIEISVLGAQHSTDLVIDETDLNGIRTTMTQTRVSTTSIDSALQGSTSGLYGPVWAKASTGTFSVSTDTQDSTPLGGFTRATAESMLTFSTLADAAVPLTFEWVGTGIFADSEGFVRLRDVTANQSLFSYAWAYGDPAGTVPWPWPQSFASLSPQPLLLASHVYDLSIHASTNAAMDGQGVSLSVHGFETIVPPVPEPKTFALMLFGLGALGLALCQKGKSQLHRPRPWPSRPCNSRSLSRGQRTVDR